jgi:two-component system, OmpR family, phosphate regulon response regulator PhoB
VLDKHNSVMARILVIEDEADIRQVIEYNLRQAGHDVTGVDRGKAGLQVATDRPPELVLLDLMLPDISGLDVCRAMKADPRLRHVAVIMLTAKGSEMDRVVGLELGADDYVTKPFSVREILLRIQAVLRRSPAGAEPAPTESTTFGRLRIDLSAHRAWVDDQEVALTALEMRLLWTLYQRRGRVQSRGRLLDDVWEADPENNTRTVDTHVKRLREKLGAASAYIETVRGVGYRFVVQPGDAA